MTPVSEMTSWLIVELNFLLEEERLLCTRVMSILVGVESILIKSD